MPDMMDTVLNLGLNPATLSGLAQLTGDERFAWDAYRRFLQMFSEIVLGTPKEKMERALERIKAQYNAKRDSDLTVEALRTLLDRFKEIIFGETRQVVPEDPEEQLQMAIAAVFDSWMNRRAVDYRRLNRISDDLGTAVTVQAMVFGLEGHYRDLQDLEFTVERGRLWMLQTRSGKRTGKAATRIAVDMV